MSAWRGAIVVAAGMVVNLCLGILYAWSVWKQKLVTKDPAQIGARLSETSDWVYLSDSEGTWAYSLCGFIFALTMIPGGRIQDRFGARVGGWLSAVCLASGCYVAAWMQSFMGLILGFGVLGGLGMGFGYAAATPVAVKWFGPHRRGLIVGLVVAGFGGAAIYISPLATWLIAEYGISGSFTILGTAFGIGIATASCFLTPPPAGFVATAPVTTTHKPATTDFTPGQMLRSWQYFALVVLFICSAQAGLFMIGNAVPILNTTAKTVPFFVANAWLLSSFGGLMNATGRIGTGSYSDRLGRKNATTLNGLIAVVAILATPTIIEAASIPLLFLVVGVVYWQYGGTLSLMPAFTADYFGPKNLGFNYGFVFLGWGIGFLVPLLGAMLQEATGRRELPFYLSASLLTLGIILTRLLYPPTTVEPAG
jgi:MFS transporter, OFA family, oxalate/formate antiporter